MICQNRNAHVKQTAGAVSQSSGEKLRLEIKIRGSSAAAGV